MDCDAAYFTNSRQAITAQNGRMLTDSCIIYGAVLTFYTLLSIATRQPPLLRNMYYVFDGLHILFCLAVFTRSAERRQDYGTTQLLSSVFIILLLSFFALEGALAAPDQHSLYVPIAILLVQLCFINRTVFSFLVILCYTAGFAALSWMNKSHQAAVNDIYIALATFISANIGHVLISRLRRNEQSALLRLEEVSRTDALTGLCNKAAAEQLCQSRLALSAGNCALIVIDIDDFKNVNDAFGHEAGDEVLKSFGALLKSSFRSADITGRFGGDEFVVLMEACGSRELVLAKLRQLQEKLEKLRFSAPGLSVRCCAGVAISHGGEDFRAVFTRADRALYKAKHQGKNDVCVDDA